MRTGTRTEHIAWCKARALAELENDHDGRAAGRAIDSMISDLSKHPATAAQAQPNGQLMMIEALAGTATPAAVRRWIDAYS